MLEFSEIGRIRQSLRDLGQLLVLACIGINERNDLRWRGEAGLKSHPIQDGGELNECFRTHRFDDAHSHDRGAGSQKGLVIMFRKREALL